ncbi:MAG TPA: glycosyltransferase [Puia sp.]|jgi:UDP:flavonoid glycosyltransferase YjiC (YdhE family)|nr:glycosyltransferase [Puia sp.]
MRYGIITTGSRGDVQPFIALALALMKKGHDVTIVASENFKDFVEGFGVSYLPVAGDTEHLINSPEALQLLEGGSIFKFFYHLQKVAAQTADQTNRDILEACSQFDGLIVSVLPLALVYSIAEKFGKKCAVVFLSVPPIPTREFPYQVLGTKGHPLFNKLSYRLMGLGYAMISKQVNRFRKEIGLPITNVMKACLRSDMLAITAVSQQFIQQPKDWPPNAHITGFFYLPPSAREKPSTNEIPEGLEDWLAKGDKPVYMGFGSIPVPDKEKLFHALQGILTQRRVVLGAGWSILHQAGGGLPTHPNLFVTKYVNHDWLLPRCSAAIIHGGIGTVSASLRSGTPIVVVSILADQPVNGKMIEQKKLGRHLPFKRLSPENLLRAIKATEAPLIKENCRATAAAIRSEDGLGNAVDLIEKYFNSDV